MRAGLSRGVKSISTEVMSSGWHIGINSEVFFAAMIPATRATEKTSPFSILSFQNERQSLGMHVNGSARDGDSAGGIFIADIDHFSATLFVQMAEFGHDLRFLSR